VSDNTTNNTRGMPNVIAKMSITKLPSSALLERIKRKPAATDAKIGSCCSVWFFGSCGPIASAP